MERSFSFSEREAGIVIAADVNALSEVTRLAEVCSEFEQVVAIKVGFSLAVRFGLAPTVEAVRSVSSLPVIYDHQKAATDIPQMGEQFSRLCAESGVNAIILFPLSGPSTLEAFIGAAQTKRIEVIVGLVMSHDKFLVSDGGYISDCFSQSVAELSLSMNVRSFVLPGNKPDIIRRSVRQFFDPNQPMNIFMPGIGRQGGSAKSAVQSVGKHRGFVIVGSSVYAANDPKTALDQIVKELS